jgi:outer membrane immunogenic protein
MNKLLFGAISALALVTANAASAADLQVQAPFVAAPAPWSWTGFYVGVNAGGSIGRNSTTQSESEGGESEILGPFNISPAGFVGGGQFGYNYQFSANWVVGLEGDFQGTGQIDTACALVCGGVETQALSTTQKLKWFGTARVRFGYTNGDWLYYATGGVAGGEVNEAFSFNVPLATPLPISVATSTNHINPGWVAGAGIETHVWGGWTVKAEYLYMDLGNIADSFNLAAFGTPVVFTTTSHISDNIIRAGVNLKFN